ncbi:MAG: sulfatase [Planctomycetota bacterium]|nr:sulfatase [Planctomycetota bacterium]
MNRSIGFAFLFFFASLVSVSEADDRPNIVWISCEDISPNLGCYGDPHAITPNLDRLAAQGVRFDRAFTPAGVCAVVRSGVITGMYPPSIGSQHMRSRIIPPPEVKAFPELLRAAGYFTTNRSKTDYQFEPTPSIWDRQGNKHQDWRERSDPEQPFFSVINITVCHESQIRHGEKRHAEVIEAIGAENQRDPVKVADTMPEYLPNTPATRKNWAWYHDNITLMDKMAGEVLQRLEEDGLADNTLVVFWSDHGMGMPRGKRWIYDTGTLIPMVMRWPGKLNADSVREDLVTVIDLPPTMLAVAGVDVPAYMHGRQLVGDQQADEPPYLFFHRDRMDEVYELQRGVRDRRWKYIRNYEPHKTYAQRLDYMDEMPAMQDWRRLATAGKLQGGQANWFQVPKPIEELYDTLKDPWELNNLASQTQYANRLVRMRAATESFQQRYGDTGLVPEAVLMEEMKPGGKTPQTEPPTIDLSGGRFSFACPTDGASIVYRVQQGDGWGSWRLYTGSFVDPGEPVQVLACRLGYANSKIVQSPRWLIGPAR